MRPAEDGANVGLISPFDPVVYERTSQKKGTTVVAASRIAADLLTSPGRGPNEAEALIRWMRRTKMPGEPDPLYVAARSALLDALEALGEQREAVILVGAQAIYLHTGAIEFPIAEYTTDADVTINPDLLKEVPEIEAALTKAHFFRGRRVGAWVTTKDVNGDPVNIELDLMVPEAVGGPGRRAARLTGHAKEVARKARGLEAALVDNHIVTITALQTSDRRTFNVAVAGPAALLCRSCIKSGNGSPNKNKAVSTTRMPSTFCVCCKLFLRLILREPLAALEEAIALEVTRKALTAMRELFADAQLPGAQMAERAAGPFSPPAQIAESCAILTRDLLQRWKAQRRRFRLPPERP